jgi:hypothetical protein
MKRLLISLTLLFAAGCSSTDKNYALMLAAYQSSTQATAAARQEQVRQMGAIAQSGDPTSKAVAVMAMAMIQMPLMDVPRPPESEALKWASIIVPSVANLGMGYFAYQAGAIASNNQRDVAISTNQAFAGMGAQIAAAGVAGYQFVQAPQPNMILSGTGVLGSGSYNAYTNSYNTTRNCTGGAAGTAVPPATAGAGGSATC